MAAIEPDGTGKRRRVTIAGEHFYFIATIGDDNWIHLTATVPDENKRETAKIRAAVEATCKELTKMVNDLLGNAGRSK